ncbi:MAG: hypothetical protein ACRERD_12230 [Candidatus Binatia bacterium]
MTTEIKDRPPTPDPQPPAIDEVSRVIARIQAGVLAVVCAVIGGVGLFAVTAWLLIKGGPRVGEHLQLLGHYFIGYSVTWTGSVVGLFYGALTGGIVGWTLATVYNKVADLRHR